MSTEYVHKEFAQVIWIAPTHLRVNILSIMELPNY